MKKATKNLFGVLLFSIFISGLAVGQSNHTITVDGTNDFNSAESVSGTSSSTWYLTWDASNFYFGILASDVSSGEGNKWVILYIDTDPQKTPASGNGTSTGVTYNTQQPTLPFNADYHFRWKADGTYTNILDYNSGTSSWTDDNTGNDNFSLSKSQSGTFLEVSIPRSSLGNPSSLNVAGSMINETSFSESTFFMIPSNDNTDAYDANLSSFYGFDLVSGITPNLSTNINSYPSSTTGSSTSFSSSSAWTNGVPDSNTNAIIKNSHSITVDSNSSVENLTVNSSGSITVSSGNSLTVLGSTSNSGSFVSQREISGDVGWRLISVPVSGGGKVTDISDDTAVQGITDGSDAGSTTNVIQYKSGTAFVAPTNTTTDFGEGFGVGLYFYNNTTNGSTALPITLDALGTEPSSDVVVALNTTAAGSGTGSEPTDSKYTLVGNPFTSNYNLNSFTVSAGTGIQDNVHFWNDGTGSYSPQSRSESSGYVIAPWQGFWVEVASSESGSEITFPTSGKATTATSGTFFSKQANKFGEIAFNLSSETTFDEAIRLGFRNDATFEYDIYDAAKFIPLLSEYATMAFKSNNSLKSVESLPYNLTEEVTLQLEEQLVGVSGEFTFDWSGMESIPADWKLTFKDYEEGTSLDMRLESKYVFEATASSNEKVNPINILTGPAAITQKSKSVGTRFEISITPNTNSVNNEPGSEVETFALDQNYPNPFNPTTTINYSVENSGAVTLSVYNLMGQKVVELVNETKSAGSYNVTWNASQAASGMYYYRLEAGGQTLTRKMTLIK